MSDPMRDERAAGDAEPGARDREIRIEELLLTGLDHYFNAQFELAINVWTRVLFLDRGHARARAYIERARSAVAERQREGDELVHAAAEAIDRGDLPGARNLLAAAAERGGVTEVAIALMQRLDRLEGPFAERAPWPAVRVSPAPGESARIEDPARTGRPGSRLAWIAGGVAAGVLVTTAAGALIMRQGFWGASEVAPASPPPAAVAEPLPVPAPSAGTLRRAQALADSGRLHDALELLDGIRTEDALYDEAGALRARVQRQLLAVGRATSPTGGTTPTR
jgi:hypothetical protein